MPVTAAEKEIYIVFSATACKMGRFIRVLTGGCYNHVSLSLDPGLKTLYSFARHYKNTPLYGGFVEESLLRYTGGSSAAAFKVCRLAVTGAQRARIEEYLDTIKISREAYVYNMISAAFFPFHHRIRINRAYTCAEFVIDMLGETGICPGFCEEKFLSVKELEVALCETVVYEGSAANYEAPGSWGKDGYNSAQPFRVYLSGTAKNLAVLVSRLFSRRAG